MTFNASPFYSLLDWQTRAGVSALAHFNSLHGIAGRAWLAKYQHVTSASDFIPRQGFMEARQQQRATQADAAEVTSGYLDWGLVFQLRMCPNVAI